MKKILLLGGSAQQVVAIETAKKLGYRTILCDFLKDNPGQYVADKFYLVSTTDKEAVLEVAQQENVDGIVAYASDPAAPTAAYVAEKLGLPTNSFASVDILGEKHNFRKFLSENGFDSPKALAITGLNNIEEKLLDFKLPIMIKPVDSSGSKGITKLNNLDKINEAFEYAMNFSRCKTVIVEEFIERDHPFMIGGDIFVLNGKVEFWGLLNCHRDEKVNPLVPVGKSYPVLMSDERIEIIHKTVQRLMDILNIKFGAFNVEMMFDSKDRLFLIEMGPRNGGNMIPDMLEMITGVNMIEATVKCAMGDFNIDLSYKKDPECFSTQNLHSDKSGIFKDIRFGEKLEKKIVKKIIYKKQGDSIEFFDGANKALGIIFMKYDGIDSMLETMKNINNEIIIEFE